MTTSGAVVIKMMTFRFQWYCRSPPYHYCDVIMNTIPSQITSLTIVYLTVNSGIDQRKHQSSASLAFVRGIHRRPVNSPHKGPVTRKMFPFDDVIMSLSIILPTTQKSRLLTYTLPAYTVIGWFTLLAQTVGSGHTPATMRRQAPHCNVDTLNWRHNECDGVSNPPASQLFI